MVHVPAKFRENTSMRFQVAVRKLNMTDRQMDGQTDGQMDGRGALQYLPSLENRFLKIARPKPSLKVQNSIGICSLTKKISYMVALGYLKLYHHYHCAYLVETKWCLKTSSGIQWVMPPGFIRSKDLVNQWCQIYTSIYLYLRECFYSDIQFVIGYYYCIYCIPRINVLGGGGGGREGYYGLVIVTPPHPQTLHRLHDNLINRIASESIFYM